MDVAGDSRPPSYQHLRNQPNTPPVFLRDFAYPDNGPFLLPDLPRMARGSIDNTSARTFAELLSGPTVDIYVGPEKKHWGLHKNLLCHHSSYFETEFQGHEVPKKEDVPQHNKLELPDDDPRGFELLVKWLYQGHLDDASHMTDESKYDYAVACHKLYQLCDKFDMILVKNLAMDAYRSNLNAAQLVPDADEINDIYRSSPPNSPFRRLMAKIAARQIMDPGVDKDAETYRVCFDNNADFAVEMINAIRYMSGGILFDDPTEGQNCSEWHDHRDGSSCYLKGKDQAPQPQQVNGTKGSIHHYRFSSSSSRASQTSSIAELSERPTPRKLNTTPQQSSVNAKSASAKRSVTWSGLANGASTTPSKPVVGTDKPHRATSNPKKLAVVNGDTPHSNGKSNGLPKTPRTPKQLPNRNGSVQPGSQKKAADSPGKYLTPRNKLPYKATTGTSDKASSIGSEPHKLSHVNGLTKQYNTMNGAMNGATNGATNGSDADSQSPAGMNDRQPPKLKRKVPG